MQASPRSLSPYTFGLDIRVAQTTSLITEKPTNKVFLVHS